MRLKLERRPLAGVIPYSNNTKLHNDADIGLIVASVERFGFNDPIAVDEKGVIVEGHGRYEAAARLGMEDVPVIVLSDLTDDQKRLYRIAHNKITLSSVFDFERLASALEEFADVDITNNMLGFADDVAGNLLKAMGSGDYTGTPQDLPIEGFEVVWADKQQKANWAAFIKATQEKYPDATPAQALNSAIDDTGILHGNRARAEEPNKLEHEYE
jgi:hypothetical protein